jgi:hypothetical protein
MGVLAGLAGLLAGAGAGLLLAGGFEGGLVTAGLAPGTGEGDVVGLALFAFAAPLLAFTAVLEFAGIIM